MGEGKEEDFGVGALPLISHKKKSMVTPVTKQPKHTNSIVTLFRHTEMGKFQKK